MSIVIIDGFDVYPDVAVTSYGLQGCWTLSDSPNIAITAGRFGAQAIKLSPANATCFMGQPVSGNTFAVGFAIRLDSNLPGSGSICFFNQTSATGTEICGVGINGSQQYYLWVGADTNIVALAPEAVTAGAWHFLEFVLTIDPAAGAMALFMDGISVATFAGAIAHGPAAYFALGNPSGFLNNSVKDFDDFYLSNTAVRVGEMRVETLYPASDVQAQWTPLTGGSNFAMVDEHQVDGDASYVHSITPGNEDLYTITQLVGSPVSIPAVQVRTCAEKDDSSTRQLATSLKSGSTLVNGPTFTVPFDSYIYERDIYLQDPHISAAWTGAAVNALNIGQKVIA